MSEEDRLLEQYKLYVEMADRVSGRRLETNKFFISILSALLAFITFVLVRNLCPGYEDGIIACFSILGLLAVGLWFLNIRSYRQLNKGKFDIIHKMEEGLPFPCYKKEWEILGEGKSKGYRTLTRIEGYVPLVFGFPYLLLLLYSIFG